MSGFKTTCAHAVRIRTATQSPNMRIPIRDSNALRWTQAAPANLFMIYLPSLTGTLDCAFEFGGETNIEIGLGGVLAVAKAVHAIGCDAGEVAQGNGGAGVIGLVEGVSELALGFDHVGGCQRGHEVNVVAPDFVAVGTFASEEFLKGRVVLE